MSEKFCFRPINSVMSDKHFSCICLLKILWDYQNGRGLSGLVKALIVCIEIVFWGSGQKNGLKNMTAQPIIHGVSSRVKQYYHC